jgi:hypothetical protein
MIERHNNARVAQCSGCNRARHSNAMDIRRLSAVEMRPIRSFACYDTRTDFDQPTSFEICLSLRRDPKIMCTACSRA